MFCDEQGPRTDRIWLILRIMNVVNLCNRLQDPDQFQDPVQINRFYQPLLRLSEAPIAMRTPSKPTNFQQIEHCLILTKMPIDLCNSVNNTLIAPMNSRSQAVETASLMALNKIRVQSF